VGKFDITLKEVLKGVEVPFCELFLGLKIKKIEEENIELLKIEEKKADYVAKIVDENDKEYILHIEFQTTNYPTMEFRMLRYFSELYVKYKLPIIQVVIYVGKNRLSMKNKIISNNLYGKINYEYTLIDIRDLDCKKFLESNNPDMLILSILCDIESYKKDELVRNILIKLEKLLNDENNFKNYYLKLDTLSELRNLNEILKKEEEMLDGYKVPIEKLASYQKGLEKGVEKGLEKGVENIVLNGLKNNIDIQTLSIITGLDEEKIKELAKKENVITFKFGEK